MQDNVRTVPTLYADVEDLKKEVEEIKKRLSQLESQNDDLK